MAAPMPAAVVLIICKTVSVPHASSTDKANAAYTGHNPREWATEHSMMVCRRQEVQVYDQSAALGADPRPFTPIECQRSGVMLGAQWDVGHPNSAYRFWRFACPVPIVDTRTGDVIAWKMPECGHRDTVVCEVDTEI